MAYNQNSQMQAYWAAQKMALTIEKQLQQEGNRRKRSELMKILAKQRLLLNPPL